MNEDTAQRHDNELDLGIKYEFLLNLESNREHRGIQLTIDQLIAALESTTTLTDLTVTFYEYESTPENNRLMVEPLCRCLSNLRSRNEHHSLRTLALYDVVLDEDVIEQFLVAAKEFGILELRLVLMINLPVEVLLDFCRDNNNLKVLEIDHVTFSSEGETAFSFPGQQGSSVASLALDKLRLEGVQFDDSTAATEFTNLVARMNVSALKLGGVAARKVDEEEEDDNDIELTTRIVSELKLPSVEQLTLTEGCRIEHFEAALVAGTTSVNELNVTIDKDDTTMRMMWLSRMIRGACKLDRLAIGSGHETKPKIEPLSACLLCQALDECTTMKRIEVNRNGRNDFSFRDQTYMYGIEARNKELGRFVASPSTYPTDKLGWLMRQFGNSPTGRYMLACRLPEIFSFKKGDCLFFSPTEPRPKKRKMS